MAIPVAAPGGRCAGKGHTPPPSDSGLREQRRAPQSTRRARRRSRRRWPHLEPGTPLECPLSWTIAKTAYGRAQMASSMVNALDIGVDTTIDHCLAREPLARPFALLSRLFAALRAATSGDCARAALRGPPAQPFAPLRARSRPCAPARGITTPEHHAAPHRRSLRAPFAPVRTAAHARRHARARMPSTRQATNGRAFARRDANARA